MGSKPKRKCFEQVKIPQFQIRLVSQTVMNLFSFSKEYITMPTHKVDSHLLQHFNCAFQNVCTLPKPGPYVSGNPHPYIHLVNWRKMVIEIKITSHVPSLAFEAY